MLISAVERQLAANTAEAYSRDISQFLAFLAGKLNKLPDMKQLLALQARDVRAFLAARRSEGVGSRSLRALLSALRMFYKFLERRGYGKNDAIRAVSLAEAAAFGAEAAHRAEGDSSGRRRRYRLTRCAGMDPGARHRRACAALRLGLAHLGGAVARSARTRRSRAATCCA